jgi:hypothetical protein
LYELFSLFWARVESASKHDKTMQTEIATWPENTLVLQGGTTRTAHGFFKNKERAHSIPRHNDQGRGCHDDDRVQEHRIRFLMMTAQIGTPQAYAEHRMAVRGDLVLALSIIRCLNIVERYLFPTIIARHILRKLPAIPFFKRNGLRLWIYVFGIAFGI